MKGKIILMTFIGLLATTTISGINVQAKSKIKINKDKVSICVGETVKLKIKGTNKKIKWSSLKKKIATVDKQGKVCGRKKGTAVITAKVSGKKLRCKVTVKKQNKEVIITGTYTMDIGGIRKPYESINESISEWISSDESVAVFNKYGEIVAHKCGNAEITCKTKEGKIYRYKVNVLPDTWGSDVFDRIVVVNDTSFNYMTDIENIPYEKEKYSISFDGFLPYVYKNETLIKLPETVFDITKPGEYYARYKATCLDCGQSQYIARVIKVLDEDRYKKLINDLSEDEIKTIIYNINEDTFSSIVYDYEE